MYNKISIYFHISSILFILNTIHKNQIIQKKIKK